MKVGLPKRPGARSRAGVTFVGILALGWGATVTPLYAQVSPPQDESSRSSTPTAGAPSSEAGRPAAVYTVEDLSYLLGPIALYPDPLLALILSASTHPVQIEEADRWIAANPLAIERRDFSQVDAMQWDASVQALVRFPDEIKLLAEHMDWSHSLGMAFSMQPNDVMSVVQMLRAQAEKVGNLKSTPEQVVTVREDAGSRVIYIAPANPERIYVPRYDTSTVFDTVLPGALVFATGVIVGSAWNSRWGWNDRRWNHVWVSPPVWRAPPPNWRPGRPGARPPAAWRPDRPGVRPERPVWRPDRPGVRPDRPGVRPDAPIVRPDRPGMGRPERPGVRPDRPGMAPDRPVVRPDRPGVRPDRPGVRPDRPAVRPDRPGGAGPGVNRPGDGRPGVNRPGANRPGNVRPGVRPDRPAAGRPPAVSRPANPQRPSNVRPRNVRQQPVTRPQQTQRARPQARPSQQNVRSQSRPQQQRSRPQAPRDRRGR